MLDLGQFTDDDCRCILKMHGYSRWSGSECSDSDDSENENDDNFDICEKDLLRLRPPPYVINPQLVGRVKPNSSYIKDASAPTSMQKENLQIVGKVTFSKPISYSTAVTQGKTTNSGESIVKKVVEDDGFQKVQSKKSKKCTLDQSELICDDKLSENDSVFKSGLNFANINHWENLPVRNGVESDMFCDSGSDPSDFNDLEKDTSIVLSKRAAKAVKTTFKKRKSSKKGRIEKKKDKSCLSKSKIKHKYETNRLYTLSVNKPYVEVGQRPSKHMEKIICDALREEAQELHIPLLSKQHNINDALENKDDNIDLTSILVYLFIVVVVILF